MPKVVNDTHDGRWPRSQPAALLALCLSGILVTSGITAQAAGVSAGVSASASGPDTSAKSNQADLAMAKRLYENGVIFYQKGDYEAARLQFEESYRLSHLPALQYNLAKTAEQQHRYDDAVRYLEGYLASNPPDADTVRPHLQVLKKAAAAHPQPPGPPVSSLAAAPATSETLNHPPWPAIGLMAGGGALLIIGIGCGAGALSAAHQVADAGNNGMYFTADLIATQQRGKDLNSAAIAFDVLGGAALAAGAAWTGYWLYQRHKAKQSQPTASLNIVPIGLGMSLIGRF